MRHTNTLNRLRCVAATMAFLALGMFGAAHADPAQFPLFLQQQIKPNVMFTLDNSGSMAWGTLTGADATAEYDSAQTTNAYYSSSYNKIYYDPAVQYAPALNYDGTSMGDSAPTSARIDAYPTTNGTTASVNLKDVCYARSTGYSLPLYDPSTFSYTSSTTLLKNCNATLGTVKISSTNYTFVAPAYSRYAFYYKWIGGTGTVNTTNSNYARVDIISTNNSYNKNGDRVCAGSTCTYNEEIQNFANWFSYYRTRIMMAKAAMGQAFAGIDPVLSPEVDPKFRVGFNTINKISGNTVSYNNDVVADGQGWLTIKNFTGSHKQSFFTKLYAVNPSQGTPLRTQMDRIGKLYSKTLSGFDYTNNDPYYLNNPTDKTLVSCRSSFHIMTTDGYWNDTYAGTDVGNQDGGCSSGATCFSTRDIGAYDANNSSKSLADIALYYYNRDLRSDLTNKVPMSDGDPSGLTDDEKGRQRMVTYTVGMGANGTLTHPTDMPGLIAGTKNWPKPSGDDPAAVDDLWHAAVNGRGAYFKANNPTELRESLVETLKNIAQVSRTASTETSNSPLIVNGTVQFEPGFKSGVWAGSLTAYGITLDTSGLEIWSKKWNAADKLPVYGSRNIATMKEDGSKVSFLWDQISSTQQTALGSADVLNYLRGDGSKEKANGGAFRNRTTTKLGDIVNSAPLYIKKGTDQGYTTLKDIGGAYKSFRDVTKAARTPMIYVGANDGMMHAFNATVNHSDDLLPDTDVNSGKELFAYVPFSVYTNLKALSDNTYDHLYYVDGQMVEGDAYMGSWKTVLIGSTGAGAKSVFAIDITDPTSLTKDSVLWEKSGSVDGDIGNVLGEARVVTMKPAGDTDGLAGEWVALFGNGYNSTNGTAKLYLKKLADGSDYAKVSTNATTGNGLSAPAVVYDSLNRVSKIYAGDLKGNLWKFDFATSPSSPTVTKLFTTATGQPIIQRPVYKQHPKGGYMVLFGTGKYFDSADGSSSDTTVQSLYGIWDKPAGVGNLTQTNLVQQTVTAKTVDGIEGAEISSNTVDWNSKYGWYVNLTLNAGERAIANPVILENVFVTKTLIPAGTLCSEGGDSYLYGINYLSGGASSPTAFEKLNIVKLSGGGTAGLQVMQKNGKIYVRTKKFSGTGSATEGKEFKAVSPGFRTWRQVPIDY